jgi:death-on-curing family protein
MSPLLLNKQNNSLYMKVLSADDIVEVNRKIIEFKKITKAEKHELLADKERIAIALKSVYVGKDLYEIAARLLRVLNKGHFFGSANKRTSYLSALTFLELNGEKIRKSDAEQSRFLAKVRSEDVSIEEIKEWLYDLRKQS